MLAAVLIALAAGVVDPPVSAAASAPACVPAAM
jgi:hypothetical protein